MGQAIGRGGLYVLDELKVPAIATTTATTAAAIDLSSFLLSPSSSFYLWHSRLFSCLKFLVFTGALGKLQTHNVFDL